MRFMLFIKPGISEDEWMPSAEAVAAMQRYNDELTKAGVLLAPDGLHPPSKGARVSFPGGVPTVTDGPYTDAHEIVRGHRLIHVGSHDEAAGRAPPLHPRPHA